MKNTIDKTKYYAKILTEEFNSLNLENNSYYTTDYILRCVEGDYEGKQIRMSELGEIFTIGSGDEANCILVDDEISPVHCVVKQVNNSIYYTLEDLGSKTGTWKRLSYLDDAMEISETTHFKVFSNYFIIEVNVNQSTGLNECVLKFVDGSLVGTSRLIDSKETEKSDTDFIEIGKKECLYELTMPCSENHVLRIQKVEGRVFVSYTTTDITNDGYFYKIQPNQKVLLRAEDCVKIGGTTLRLLSHNYGIFNEIMDKFYQEDTFTIIDDLKIFDTLTVPFYAVYDGHGVGGGDKCSTYLKTYFHKNLRFLCKLRNLKDSKNFFVDFCKIIQETIVYTDISFNEKEKINGLNQGSSFLGLFFIGNKIISCNVGDSLGILIKNDKEILLNREHKPSWDKELDRIQKKNGIVTGGKIFGALSVSKSFGDWKLKDPAKAEFIKRMFAVEIDEYLIDNRAEFRIYETDLKEDEYIIITTSGLLEWVGKQKLVEYVEKAYLNNERSENSSLKNIPLTLDKLRLEIVNDLYMNEKNKNIENLTLIIIDLQN